MQENSFSNRLFYMPRRAQETDIIRQRGADKATHIAWMEEMARQGRTEVSRRHPQPTWSPSSCRLIEGRSRPRAETHAIQPEERASSGDQSPTVRADAIAEREQRAAIARSRPFFQIAAVRATLTSPRHVSPDYYGLRAHLTENRRHLAPADSPPRWPPSYGGVE